MACGGLTETRELPSPRLEELPQLLVQKERIIQQHTSIWPSTIITSRFCPPGGSKAQKFYGKHKVIYCPLPRCAFQIKTPIPHQWCLQPPSFKASSILWANNKDSLPELYVLRRRQCQQTILSPACPS